ncbi:hypothetical protein DLJ49_02925 [Rhodovulum sp. 12E13]|uniref:hypothetical protein n=1 Tax=Rhodovulum sp. 12E13 TaxID=2203891 RepID=UPI000E16C742|nr:hypothetical protein [Rhodovulum sp. 12E13]RDC74948.1 hypothetical protein DLJ49_02925 [Rhodovulum sp. 12E13]
MGRLPSLRSAPAIRPPWCRALASAVAALALGGCAQFPELDRAISPQARAAPAPRIEPLGPLLAEPGAGQAEIARDETLARAEALRAAGAALAGQAPDPQAQERIAERRRRLAAERAALSE